MELMLIIETIICIILLLLLVRSNRKQTSYKAREAKIIDSQQFCLNILDNLPFPVFVKDINDDFRYKLWNKEAERKSGTTQMAWIPKRSAKFWDTPILKYTVKNEVGNIAK